GLPRSTQAGRRQNSAWSSPQMAALVPALLPFWASAARTLSGVIGRERTRTPMALNTALAMAAAVGMLGGSPRPIIPQLLPALARSKATAVISGISMGPATLYIIRSAFICGP